MRTTFCLKLNKILDILVGDAMFLRNLNSFPSQSLLRIAQRNPRQTVFMFFQKSHQYPFIFLTNFAEHPAHGSVYQVIFMIDKMFAEAPKLSVEQAE
jgi:hypothetical protein